MCGSGPYTAENEREAASADEAAEDEREADEDEHLDELDLTEATSH